jgi:hypothetical protein
MAALTGQALIRVPIAGETLTGARRGTGETLIGVRADFTDDIREN